MIKFVLLGLAAAQPEEEEVSGMMREGRCPITKEYQFDPASISNREYKLLYGDSTGAEGSHCASAKLAPFGDG